MKNARNGTYSPVGCSYFPDWGVSRVAVTDMVVAVNQWMVQEPFESTAF